MVSTRLILLFAEFRFYFYALLLQLGVKSSHAFK